MVGKFPDLWATVDFKIWQKQEKKKTCIDPYELDGVFLVASHNTCDLISIENSLNTSGPNWNFVSVFLYWNESLNTVESDEAMLFSCSLTIDTISSRSLARAK